MLKKPPEFGGLTHKIRKIVFSCFRCPVFAFLVSRFTDFNAAFYHQCRADVVITKASGAEGGYQEKVQPCLDAGIPCIVIARPTPLVTGDELLESQAAFAQRLSRWLAAAKE